MAADKVGNTATSTFAYAVIYGTRLLYDPAKAANAGSTYPIKLQVVDAGGINQSASSLPLTAVMLDTASANTSAHGTFRYDPKLGNTGGYQLNFDTSGLPSGSYVLEFTAGIFGYRYAAPFSVR